MKSDDLISRQEAIDALDTAIEHYDGIAEECRKKADIERNDYMDMRDDAYEARQLAQWLNELKYLREKIKQLTAQPEKRTEKRMETHACDCISRAEVIELKPEFLNPNVNRKTKEQTAIDRAYARGWNSCNTHWIKEIIEDLPSAQPEPKIGRWIDDNCSECGQYVFHGDARNFCPNCGAKMENDL